MENYVRIKLEYKRSYEWCKEINVIKDKRVKQLKKIWGNKWNCKEIKKGFWYFPLIKESGWKPPIARGSKISERSGLVRFRWCLDLSIVEI